MRALLLPLLVTVSGCFDSQALVEDIKSWNEMFTDTDTDTSSTDTTGTTASGSSLDSGSGTLEEPDTEPTGGEIGDAVMVELHTDTDLLVEAGSVVVTATIAGPATEVTFTVNGNPHPWPLGEEKLEFIVDSTAYNGLLVFGLTVVGEAGGTDFATAAVTVALPESGSVKQRIVDPSDATRGSAFAIVPGSGNEPDTVWVAGNADGLLRFSRVDHGQLWTTTVPDPMAVTAVAIDDEASFFVAGKLGDDLKLRRYRNLGGEWVAIWKRTIEHAVANDVKIGPDGLIYVAGAQGFENHHEAVVWIFSDSGGEARKETYSAFWEDVPLSSEAHEIAFADTPFIVGDLEKKDDSSARRAALFTLSDSGLTLAAHETESPSELETSTWLDVVETPDGWMATGWQKQSNDSPPALTRGLFSSEFGSAAVALAEGYRGQAIAWHPGGFEVVAGSKIDANLNPVFFAQGGTWLPYLDIRGVGYDVVVDRHGYTHITGEVVEDGVSHLVWITVNP